MCLNDLTDSNRFQLLPKGKHVLRMVPCTMDVLRYKDMPVHGKLYARPGSFLWSIYLRTAEESFALISASVSPLRSLLARITSRSSFRQVERVKRASVGCTSTAIS